MGIDNATEMEMHRTTRSCALCLWIILLLHLTTALSESAELTLPETLSYIQESLKGYGTFVDPPPMLQISHSCTMSIGDDGTISITQIESNPWDSGQIHLTIRNTKFVTFKLNELDACAVTVKMMPAYHWAIISLYSYLRRMSFRFTGELKRTPAGQPQPPPVPPSNPPNGWYSWGFVIGDADGAIKIARAFKRAIILSGAPKDPFGDNCDDKDVTIEQGGNANTNSAPPAARQATQPNKPPPQPKVPLKIANATVSLQFIEGKPFLVITNPSDQDATVYYSAEYKDSSGKWCNKLHGQAIVAKHGDFKYELYDELAVEWRAQKEGEQ
jgi:hypothetical protein